MKSCLLIPLVVAVGACTPPESGRERVLLVTTTTVEGSGLLDVLVEAYHASQDLYHVSAAAAGSGAALEIGRRGDADLLITHDSAGEARFMAAGHGVEQGPLMRNQFVLAGPPADPAGVRGMADLPEALDRIARTGQTFVSRADDSGTHVRERELWARAGRPDRDDRPASYVETGSGMAETLRVADHRDGYVVSDLGTFRHLAQGLDLELLVQPSRPEVNRYQYTVPSGARRSEGARHFLAWLLGPGQQVIGEYGVARFGEPLFQPAASATGR